MGIEMSEFTDSKYVNPYEWPGKVIATVALDRADFVSDEAYERVRKQFEALAVAKTTTVNVGD